MNSLIPSCCCGGEGNPSCPELLITTSPTLNTIGYAHVNGDGTIQESWGVADPSINVRVSTGRYNNGLIKPEGALTSNIKVVEAHGTRDSITERKEDFLGDFIHLTEGDNGPSPNTPRDRPYTITWYGLKDEIVDVTINCNTGGTGGGGTGGGGTGDCLPITETLEFALSPEFISGERITGTNVDVHGVFTGGGVEMARVDQNITGAGSIGYRPYTGGESFQYTFVAFDEPWIETFNVSGIDTYKVTKFILGWDSGEAIKGTDYSQEDRDFTVNWDGDSTVTVRNPDGQLFFSNPASDPTQSGNQPDGTEVVPDGTVVNKGDSFHLRGLRNASEQNWWLEVEDPDGFTIPVNLLIESYSNSDDRPAGENFRVKIPSEGY